MMTVTFSEELPPLNLRQYRPSSISSDYRFNAVVSHRKATTCLNPITVISLNPLLSSLLLQLHEKADTLHTWRKFLSVLIGISSSATSAIFSPKCFKRLILLKIEIIVVMKSNKQRTNKQIVSPFTQLRGKLFLTTNLN